MTKSATTPEQINVDVLPSLNCVSVAWHMVLVPFPRTKAARSRTSDANAGRQNGYYHREARAGSRELQGESFDVALQASRSSAVEKKECRSQLLV